MQAQRTAQTLGFAGLIPFYGALLAFVMFEDYPRSLAIQGFLVYSLAILCFLAGALWGYARCRPAREQGQRLLVSNGIVLFAVASMLTAQFALAALLLMLGYLALLWFERNVDGSHTWYARMRWQLTLGVIVAHGLYIALHSTGA